MALLCFRAVEFGGQRRSLVEVSAYVLWRRATLDDDPQRKVANWQRLLEEHPDVQERYAGYFMPHVQARIDGA